MLWDQSRTRALGSGYISARISNIPYAVKRENLKCMGMMLDNLCHITTVLSDRQGALIGQFKTLVLKQTDLLHTCWIFQEVRGHTAHPGRSMETLLVHRGPR